MKRFVVLGGGYAGTLAALRLARKPEVRSGAAEVVLVDAKAAFVERIRLHQRAAGGGSADRPYERILAGSGVRFVQAGVERIAAGELGWTGGGLSFDGLVIALGSMVDRDRVPGVRDHALCVGNADEVGPLTRRLADLALRDGTIAVVGGGLTGVETASELAERLPGLRVRLVTSGRLGDDLSERGAAHVQATMARLGVDVVERARALAVDTDGVVTAAGPIDADQVVWAGPMVAPRLLRDAGFAVDDAGRAIVDDRLRSISHPWAFVAGDAARVAMAPGPGGPAGSLRMACATAMPMGAYAADALSALASGQEPAPFRFVYLARCISLGRRDALVQWVDAHDAPRGVWTGWTGAAAKEAICRFTVAMIELQRAGIDYRWPTGTSSSAEAIA